MHGRRRFLHFSLRGLAVLAAPAALTQCVAAGTAAREVRVAAQRFRFDPNAIALKLNQPVTFVLHTQDVPMGFSLPDFNLRTDLLPGRVTTLHLVPDKLGEFVFLCDVFCGSGHEQMNGVLTVTA